MLPYVMVGIFIIGIIALILNSPFKYPFYEKTFDVSGKRNPDIENLIEQFICEGGFDEIKKHEFQVNEWKEECGEKVENAILKKLRKKQFENCLLLNDNSGYRFQMIRNQTRYKQQNYQKTSYQVSQTVDKKSYGFEWLEGKYKELESIRFESTLKDYNSKNQRKLMTKELRESIARRDNYTCKICGKYMPDSVGLQIDHIIPVAKGGKSVPSNLQVLCSKCNGSKSDKIA